MSDNKKQLSEKEMVLDLIKSKGELPCNISDYINIDKNQVCTDDTHEYMILNGFDYFKICKALKEDPTEYFKEHFFIVTKSIDLNMYALMAFSSEFTCMYHNYDVKNGLKEECMLQKKYGFKPLQCACQPAKVIYTSDNSKFLSYKKVESDTQEQVKDIIQPYLDYSREYDTYFRLFTKYIKIDIIMLGLCIKYFFSNLILHNEDDVDSIDNMSDSDTIYDFIKNDVLVTKKTAIRIVNFTDSLIDQCTAVMFASTFCNYNIDKDYCSQAEEAIKFLDKIGSIVDTILNAFIVYYNGIRKKIINDKSNYIDFINKRNINKDKSDFDKFLRETDSKEFLESLLKGFTTSKDFNDLEDILNKNKLSRKEVDDLRKELFDVIEKGNIKSFLQKIRR